MVGGEAIGNTEIKERRKKKKKHAEEKRRALAGTFFVALLVFLHGVHLLITLQYGFCSLLRGKITSLSMTCVSKINYLAQFVF